MSKSKLPAALACAAIFFSVDSAAREKDRDERCPGGRSLSLVNGRIHTMDKHDRVVSSVLIENGRFAAVGHGGPRGSGECHEVIDLRGRTAVPGIIDNHNHIVLLGLRPGHDTRIENARSIEDVKKTFAARTRDRGVKKGDWLTALGGFNVSQFAPEFRLPTLQELDAVTPDHPVLIMQGFDGPTVTNGDGKAFFESLKPPITVAADGSIARGGMSVRALNALRFLQTFDEQKRGLGYAMTYAAEVGITTHLDQGGFHYSGLTIDSNNGVDALAHFHPYRAHDSLRALHQEGGIFNRIWINFLHMEDPPSGDTPELRARLLNAWNDFGDDMVRVLGIGEFTAGNPFIPGSPVWFNGTRLVALARWRNENHSLGFGNPPDWKVIIDGWQTVHDEIVKDKTLGLPDGIRNLRWVLAHVPFIDGEYLDRLHGLGGGISLVGGWRYISGTAAGNGPPFKLILDHKIRSGLSSDGMQIAPMNPWLGMYYAVSGCNARGEPINASQRITRKEALRLYTADNAWFLDLDGKIGTIEEGRFGDLIVLSDDYFDEKKVTTEEIKDIYSMLTVVNGRVVHDDLDGRKRMYWKLERPAPTALPKCIG